VAGRRPEPTIGSVRAPFAAISVLAILAALAGCSTLLGPSAVEPGAFEPEGRALGRIDTALQAAEAAITLSSLARPITILDVRGGRAGDIYTGAYPSWVSGNPEMERNHERFLAKLERPAWRVHLSGGPPPANESCCVWQELIIDQETGSLLFWVGADGIPDAPIR